MYALLMIAALPFLGHHEAARAVPKPPLPPSVIMARVAANQDRSNKLRADYVYRESVRVASRKAGGKLMCEEDGEFLIVPGPSSTTRKMTQIAIRYWHNGKYINLYAKPAKDLSVDCDIAGSFLGSYGESKSKNGIEMDLFPPHR